MPRLRRFPRTVPKPQPRILALAVTRPYCERCGWWIEALTVCDAGWIARVQSARYRVTEAPLTGFAPYNAVIYSFGATYLARLDPAPTERPFWPPRPELAEILRLNRRG